MLAERGGKNSAQYVFATKQIKEAKNLTIYLKLVFRVILEALST